LQAGELVGVEAEGPADLREVLPLLPVDVDPEQLAIAERLGGRGLELDVVVAPIRVEEMGTDPGRAQRSPARSTAAATAIIAALHWTTTIARSGRSFPVPGGSGQSDRERRFSIIHPPRWR
jgi:hypothetical protein